MATPFNLTFADISKRVMNDLRLPLTNTEQTTRVDAIINDVYRDIYVKYDWWWLVKHVVINTGPKITAGTVSLVQNNTTINFTTVPSQFGVAVTVAGFALTIPGQANDPSAVYRISGHLAPATVAVLDGAYTDVTNSAAGYRMYQDRYALPVDMGKLLGVTRYGEVIPIRRIGIERMQEIKQIDQTEDRPELYTIYDFVNTGDPTTQRLLWIHPYPDKAYRMDIYYKQELNTEMACGDQGYMPDEYRQLLVYGALARGLPIFHKDFDGGKYYQSLFNDALALMVAQHKEYAVDKPSLVPEAGYRRQRPNRRMSNVTLGSWFDRWPNVP